MLRKYARILSMSTILTALCLSFFSSSVFAQSSQKMKPATSYYYSACGGITILYNGSSVYTSNSGNYTGCLQQSFDYEPLAGGNNKAQATWSFFTPDPIATCNIDAWFPYGDLSTDTKTRYDFWYGTKWLAWPGYDINQYSAPAGWNRIVTNLRVNGNGGTALYVTAHDDGGTGNLAFADVQFNCSN